MGVRISPSFASPGWSLVHWLNIRLHQEPVLHKVTGFKATTTTKTQQQKKQQPSAVSDCMHFCISVLGFDERHRNFFFEEATQPPPSPPPNLLLAQPSRNSTYCCGDVRGQPLIRCDTSASHLSSRQSSRGYWQQQRRRHTLIKKNPPTMPFSITFKLTEAELRAGEKIYVTSCRYIMNTHLASTR